LDNSAQIVELSAICAHTGKIIVDSLVKPTIPIPADATHIHGITNEDVKDALDFHMVFSGHFLPLLNGRRIITYNSDFDKRMILQSLALHCNAAYLQSVEEMFNLVTPVCAMLWYSEFYGECYYNSDEYRWQSLVNACKQQNIDVSDLTAHRALSDCEMTRRLIHSVNAHIEIESEK
ncbi:3'-5' exonuclease, partial [Vibrio nigripulchritudo]